MGATFAASNEGMEAKVGVRPKWEATEGRALKFRISKTVHKRYTSESKSKCTARIRETKQYRLSQVKQ